MKIHLHRKLGRSKNCFLGGPQGGVGTPKLCQNVCLLSMCLYQKKTGTFLVCANQKINFGGVHGG